MNKTRWIPPPLKRWRAGAFAGMIFLAASFSAGAAQAVSEAPSIHGEYSSLGALHRTGGAGNRTLIRRGNFLTQELKLKIDQPLPDHWDFLTNVHVRQTADPKTDKRKDVHLLGYTSEIYNPFLHFTFGDFFGDLSQYSMSQSLKGVQAAAKDDTTELKVLAGYSQKADEGRHFMRYVFGGRLETMLVKSCSFIKDLRLGFNFSEVEDDSSSIVNKAGIADASNRVGSFNSRALLWDKTDVEAEMAKSWIDEDTSPGNRTNRKAGTALRVKTSTKFSKEHKLKLDYEWAGTQFSSLSGSAIPDRVSVFTRWDGKWNKELASEASYRISYDKLGKSTLNKRTITQVPRVALNWTREELWHFLKDFFARLYWELRSRASDDDPTGQIDFLANEFGLEDEFKIDKIIFNSGLTLRNESDDFAKVNSRFITTGYLGLKRREKFLNLEATPMLRYQFNYENKPKEEGRDLTQTFTAGLDLDFSESLKFEQKYSFESVSRLAYDADTFRFNARLGLDYKIPLKADLTLKVGYEYTHFIHPQSTERFNEHNFQTRLVWKF